VRQALTLPYGSTLKLARQVFPNTGHPPAAVLVRYHVEKFFACERKPVDNVDKVVNNPKIQQFSLWVNPNRRKKV
jgi:hypothetical protein